MTIRAGAMVVVLGARETGYMPIGAGGGPLTTNCRTTGMALMKTRRIPMEKIALVQKIGNEVCEGCSPNADCGEIPIEDCSRIQNAIKLLCDHLESEAATDERPATDEGMVTCGENASCLVCGSVFEIDGSCMSCDPEY